MRLHPMKSSIARIHVLMGRPLRKQEQASLAAFLKLSKAAGAAMAAFLKACPLVKTVTVTFKLHNVTFELQFTFLSL